MKLSEKGLLFICNHEGFFTKPYICPAGKPTIGFGTTYYEDGRKVKLTDPPITMEKAKNIVRNIITKNYEKEVNNLLKKTVTQNQFDALVSFAYNLGSANLAKSTLLKKVNVNPNDPAIRNEFNKWVNAGGKKFKGLEIRRRHEADLYFK